MNGRLMSLDMVSELDCGEAPHCLENRKMAQGAGSAELNVAGVESRGAGD